jgi:hypothetical protein
VLQAARAQLAIELVQQPPAPQDEVDRLAGLALQHCRRDSAACADARAYAHHALKALARLRGDVSGTVTHARAMVDDLQRGHGADHAETVMAQLDLSAVLRNAGALLEAEAVLQQAQVHAERAQLRAVDALQLRITSAVLQVDLGRLDSAQAALQSLIDDASAASQGPLLWRLLALVQIERGQAQAAWNSADRGWRDARAQQDEWQQALAQQARARAATLLGRHAEAGADLQGVADWLAKVGIADDSVEQLRLRRLNAELALRRGAWPRAAELLAVLPAGHHLGSGPVRAPVDLAQALHLSAGLASLRAEHDSAAAQLRQAGDLLAAALPPEHPLRLRHAIATAHADALRAGGRSTGPLQQAVASFLARQPADSVWHDRLQGLVRNPAAGIPGVI